MTNPTAPSDLYLQLQDQLGEIRDLVRKVVDTTAEYRLHEPETLEVDTLGDPTTGPEALAAVLRGLKLVDQALDATDTAYRNVLADAGRLYVKE
ncbi:hypothetical protein [Rhodococcus sp. IEGM 1379]|uniref:hypothetical protein n=1 Tax=Rhodococcus sp. IEGM 1379 TaxID=3047086 RepID=UPI0024B6EB72|nr:hypothetical protein [Rhodococcus sp. IEGM 1379]MDI9917752.1 hypothetical protein [Rhodococcus sp. IEGM 1379]